MRERVLNVNSKKRILMVHNYYQIGGGEHTVFHNEVKLLRDHGHTVIEYTRSNDELAKSKLKLLFSPLSTIWSIKTYMDVKKIIKKEKIDVVHCHNTFPLISPSVYYAARKCRIPVIQTIHNFRFLCPNASLYCDGKICEKCLNSKSFKKAIENKCYRESTIQTMIVVAMLKIHRLLGTYKKINYIFLTDFNRKKFKNLIDINGDNVFIKPNFVYHNTSFKDEEKSTSSEENDQKYIFVFAGRLEQNKGILSLIDMWKKLPEIFELHIYGEGTYKSKVSEYAKRFRNIKYYGFQEQEIVFRDSVKSIAVIISSEWY